MASMNRIFVYGTLKAGFANHDEMLMGERFLGAYITVEKYPLVITGPWYSPVMFPEPGKGYCVTGEVYEVNNEKLMQLDEFEYVHLVKGFRRLEIDVVSDKGKILRVEAYMRAREFIKEIRSGYLKGYLDNRYIHESKRPK